jgi:hypothetical protein
LSSSAASLAARPEAGEAGGVRLRWLAAGGALVTVASRLAVRPSVPDDYDAYGFALAMGEKFDLGLFQPHFPGYPAFVAPGVLLCSLGMDGLAAATLLSALASGVAGLSLALIALRLGGPRAAVGVLLLHAAAFLPWLTGSSALSDAAGVACAAGAFALLFSGQYGEGRPLLAGLLCGVLLGVRLSDWPLALSALVIGHRLLPGRERALRLLGGCALGVLSWAAPFVWLVGPRRLLALGETHVAGHFGAWGGALSTRPGLGERAFATLRGLLFDGLAPEAWALAAIALVCCWALFKDRAPGRLHLPALLAALGPYALWVFAAQNVVEQPRHLLPLVEGLLLLLALGLAARPAALGAVAALCAAAALPLLYLRLHQLPAGAQAARFVAAQGDAAGTFVAAGRSARFFRSLAPQVAVQEHLALGDLTNSLARLGTFPARIFVTSEIDLTSGRPGRPLPDHWSVRPGPVFCRDARLDRAHPCLSLQTLVWSPR